MCKPVHPRLRGELDSDRMRDRIHDRFIPAYAGNSLHYSLFSCSWSVHPRLRGELLRTARAVGEISGSSPLTRGTLDFDGCILRVLRFIPAYAGNSTIDSINSFLISVHPRLRGEL